MAEEGQYRGDGQFHRQPLVDPERALYPVLVLAQLLFEIALRLAPAQADLVVVFPPARGVETQPLYRARLHLPVAGQCQRIENLKQFVQWAIRVPITA